jgi:Flp pilus assembly protein protease CpaA
MKIEVLLLILVLCLAAYDARTQCVPNWVTLPLLASGMLLHFPGLPVTWLACLLLFSAWRLGVFGGGDAKLWMALLWLVPPGQAQWAVWVMAVAFGVTAGLQMLWRVARKQPAWGSPGPGVWRAIPFTLWLLAARIGDLGMVLR